MSARCAVVSYRTPVSAYVSSDELPFGRLWYGEPNAVSNAIGYAKHRSRSHDAVIRVYDAAGNVIETHKHAEITST
jgi:hypothetical protein